MAYQVTTKTSYGQRLSNSFKGIASGFVLFIAGTILLFWNEGNFVKTKKSIQEAENVVVKVSDVSTVDPAQNGQLIHASAFADTEDVLTDGLFGINEKAISISRKVEYYQYKEIEHKDKKDKIGGGQEAVKQNTNFQFKRRLQTLKALHPSPIQSTIEVLPIIIPQSIGCKAVTLNIAPPAVIISHCPTIITRAIIRKPRLWPKEANADFPVIKALALNIFQN